LTNSALTFGCGTQRHLRCRPGLQFSFAHPPRSQKRRRQKIAVLFDLLNSKKMRAKHDAEHTSIAHIYALSSKLDEFLSKVWTFVTRATKDESNDA